MGVTSVGFVSSLIAAVAAGCGDDPPLDEGGRPATFGEECMLGGLDICQAPFVCLELPNFSPTAPTETICTLACQQSDDCPAWDESEGPCKGRVQSQCVRQICRDACPR